jgi:hypothetical protein
MSEEESEVVWEKLTSLGVTVGRRRICLSTARTTVGKYASYSSLIAALSIVPRKPRTRCPVMGSSFFFQAKCFSSSRSKSFWSPSEKSDQEMLNSRNESKRSDNWTGVKDREASSLVKSKTFPFCFVSSAFSP